MRTEKIIEILTHLLTHSQYIVTTYQQNLTRRQVKRILLKFSQLKS